MDHKLPDPDRADTGEPAPRKNQGEAHPRAKLSDAQVIAIRSSHLSPREAAQIYGISRSHVVNIRAGRRWPHLE